VNNFDYTIQYVAITDHTLLNQLMVTVLACGLGQHVLCLQSSLDSTASMNVRNINLDKNKRQEIRNRNQSAIVLLQLLDTASRRHLDYLNDCHLCPHVHHFINQFAPRHGQ
jgi:hypothetical protein